MTRCPFQAQWCQMVTLQSVQGHAGRTHPLKISCRSVTLALRTEVPECQKIKNGGLDQHGAECFGGLIFATVRKSVGLKALYVI